MRHLLALLIIGLGSLAWAAPQHQESRSSVVAEYVSLELGPLSPCAGELRSTKIAFPVEGGDGQIDQTYTDTCRGAPAAMKLALHLQREGAGYKLVVTEPGGQPIPVSLAIGKHLSLRLDQGEFDLSLTKYGG